MRLEEAAKRGDEEEIKGSWLNPMNRMLRRGGSIYVVVDPGLTTLRDFEHKRRYAAGDGGPGGGKKSHGKAGTDLVVALAIHRYLFENGLADEACSLARTVSVIGDRWTLLILRDCFLRVRRRWFRG